MRINRNNIIMLLVLVGFTPDSALSQPDVPNQLHTTVLAGIDSLYNLRFSGAEAAFDEAIRIAPEDPRGWFFKSMVSFYIYQLSQSEAAYDRFFDLSETVIERAEEIVDDDDTNLTAKFYLGGIYGYRGLAFQRNGNLLSALWDGRKGYGYLRDAATGPAELWIVAGPGHGQAYSQVTEEYQQRVINFFNRYLLGAEG